MLGHVMTTMMHPFISPADFNVATANLLQKDTCMETSVVVLSLSMRR